MLTFHNKFHTFLSNDSSGMLRISILVLNPCMGRTIRLITPMDRILRDKTYGSIISLNLSGMLTLVFINDLQCLLILNYHFSRCWNYLMCQSWWMIRSFITYIGLQFQPKFLVIVPNLRASPEKIPKCMLWHTIFGVPLTLGLTILSDSVFSNGLLLVPLPSGTSSYIMASSKISIL